MTDSIMFQCACGKTFVSLRDILHHNQTNHNGRGPTIDLSKPPTSRAIGWELRRMDDPQEHAA